MSTILHSSRDGAEIGKKRQLIRAKSQEIGKTLLQKAKKTVEAAGRKEAGGRRCGGCGDSKTTKRRDDSIPYYGLLIVYP